MPNLIHLTCPSCGGKLELTSDVERFSCGYCGTEQIVRRSGGIITLEPVVSGLKEIKTGVDKTASELAIARLTKELSNLYARRQTPGTASGNAGCAGVAGLGAVVLGGAGLLGMWVGPTTTIDDLMCIAGVLLFAVAIYAFQQLQKKTQQHIAAIDREIASVNAELRKHQEIVAEDQA